MDSDDYVVATYLLRSRYQDILKKTADMAVEQTTGTRIKVPGETKELTAKHQGKVLGVWEIPDLETKPLISDNERTHVFQIAYPVANIGSQIPMLLTTVFGNISMMGDISGRITPTLGIWAVQVGRSVGIAAPLCYAYSSHSEIHGLQIALKGGQVGEDDYFGEARDKKVPDFDSAALRHFKMRKN